MFGLSPMVAVGVKSGGYVRTTHVGIMCGCLMLCVGQVVAAAPIVRVEVVALVRPS